MDLFEKFEYKVYHPVIWFLSFVPAIALGAGDTIGASGVWCWISNDYPSLRLILLFIYPIGLGIVTSEITTVFVRYIDFTSLSPFVALV